MFRALKDALDVSMVATDGEIGRISNSLFDDRSWMIRYFVVDVGNWLARRPVVISVNVMDPPDWENRTFRIRLTRDQVRHSPDVDSAKPVTRQQEIAMREHYGWPACWENPAPEFTLPPLAAGETYPVSSEEDSHLRSADDVAGYEVWAHHQHIGKIEDFIVDARSWHISYLDVRTGDWLHHRSLLVSSHSVAAISWATHRVNLTHA